MAMTREVFEKNLLEGQSLDEYIKPDGIIDYDLIQYYKFKLNISIFIESLEEYIERTFLPFNKPKARRMIASFSKLKECFYDPDLEFNALEIPGEIGFKLYFETVPAQEAIPQKNALKRLYHYTKMEQLTPRQTLSRFTEQDFGRGLKSFDAGLYGHWAKIHPEEAKQIESDSQRPTV